MSVNAIDLQVYDQLVTEAYKIGTGENTPQDFLDFYGAIFPSQSSTIIGYDAKRPGRDVFAFSNFAESCLIEYSDYYSKIHPYAAALLNAPPYIIGRGEYHMSDEELFQTEYYNDFLKPNGDVSQTIGVPVFKEDDRFLMWSNNYAPRFLEEAAVAETAMALLVPHIRRSFELARRLEQLEQKSQSLEQALNRFSNPVFICSANMNLQFSNSAAEAALSAGQIVTATQNVLHFNVPEANLAIRQQVRNFAQNDFATISLTNNLFIRTSNPSSATRFAFVTPLPDEPNAQRSIFGTLFERPVMIMLIDPERGTSVQEDVVQAMFNVTPAEAALACALAQGMTPNEYAEARHVSKNTVRVQTQSLLGKMGARRQSDITRMLATAFAGLRMEPESGS